MYKKAEVFLAWYEKVFSCYFVYSVSDSTAEELNAAKSLSYTKPT